MERRKRIRNEEQQEIQNVANEYAGVAKIDTHTLEYVEETIGFTWTNLAHIYFEDDATIQSIHTLRDELDELGYLAVVEEQRTQISINVESTLEVFERFDEEGTLM